MPQSISVNRRPITTANPSILRLSRLGRQSLIIPLQRRYASGEITQAEPEANGATEAEHGENSIASSIENDTPRSPDPEDHSTIASSISSAADTVSTKASDIAGSVSAAAENARESVADATQAASDYAGSARKVMGRPLSTDGPRRTPAPPSATLYVGNLYFDVTQDQLREQFEEVGAVANCKIVYDSRGLSKGYVANPIEFNFRS